MREERDRALIVADRPLWIKPTVPPRRSSDLRTWQSKLVIHGENEQLLNSSACKASHGFAMAYESNAPA